MKKLLILSASVAILGACDFLPPNPEAKQALAAMKLDKSGAGYVTYAKLAQHGSDALITDAKLVLANGLEIPVKKITLKGLSLSKDNTHAPIVKSLEFDGVSYALSGVPGASVNAKIAKLSLQNVDAATGRLAASLFEKGDKLAALPKPDEIAFKDWRIEGVDVDFKLKNADSAGTVKIASLSSGGLAKLVAKSSVLSGLAIDVNTARTGRVLFTLDSAKADRPNLFTVQSVFASLGALAQPQFDPAQWVRAAGEANYQTIVAHGPLETGYDKLSFTNFAFIVGGVQGKLASYSGEVTRDKDGFATALALKSSPLTISPYASGPGSEKFKKFLDDMGYPALAFSIGGAASFDRKTDLLKISGSKIEMANAGALQFDLGLENLVGGAQAAVKAAADIRNAPPALSEDAPDAPAVDGDPAAPAPDLAASEAAQKAFLGAMALRDGALTWSDSSLIDRFMTAIAKQTPGGQGDVAKLRQQALALVGQIKAGPEDPASAAGLIDALRGALTTFLTKAFARQPTTLTLSAHPGKSLKFDQETQTRLTADPSILGFQASAK